MPSTSFMSCLLSTAVSFATCAAHVARDQEHLPRSQPSYDSCCGYLEHSLGSKISYPNSSVYSTSLNSYWTDQESSLKPSCIVSPTSAEDVSEAIKLLAKQSQCKFAVRGGGHTPWTGAANINDGVTISLSGLDDITLSADKSIASVGGGALLGQMYAYLDPLNLGVVGGRVSQVGVGGLTIGGGISFFSPRFGFACDAVESFELVGADGTIETISASNKPDLFRALKGGSNNFGIVTHYNLRTFPSGDIWGGNVYNDISTYPQQAIAFEQLTGNSDYDPYSALIHNYVWFTDEPQGFIVNQFSYTKVPAVNELPATFSAFGAIPSTGNDTFVRPLANLTADIAPPTPYTRQLFITLSYTNSASFYTAFLTHFNKTVVPPLLAAGIPQISLTYQPLPQVITSKSNSTGGNVLGYDPSDGDVVNVLSGIAWYKAEDDELVYGTLEKAFDEGKEMAENMGVASPKFYLNYAAKWQDPIAGYGAEEVEFLRGVSEKYDPKGMFQTQMPGGFKLWTGRGTG